MALREERRVNKVEIVAGGTIQVQYVDVLIRENGEERELGYHRASYEPGADVSGTPGAVAAHAAVAWTPDVVAAHKAKLQGPRK